MPEPDRLSSLFDALAHPFRRVTLYYLSERESASLETLAACVTGWARSGPGFDFDPQREPPGYEAVRAELHHVHLPHIEDAGFAAYDPEARRVASVTLPPAADDVLSTAVAADTGDARLDVDALVGAVDDGDV